MVSVLCEEVSSSK
ncbi:hypothetical protein QZH41_010781 [Actinostola sp. cb2023]|nr:hypothetical protein QZH41_010781 [Actinostola sp. cb2023]